MSALTATNPVTSRLRYRAWDHRVGGFSYFSARDSSGRVPLDIPDAQVQQCTGLRDAECRDIYEGDIVSFDDSDWNSEPVVGFAEVVHCGDLMLVPAPSWVLYFADGVHRSMLGEMRIVGNIFQTPVLVGQDRSGSDPAG
jgi:hypothetical protein